MAPADPLPVVAAEEAVAVAGYFISCTTASRSEACSQTAARVGMPEPAVAVLDNPALPGQSELQDPFCATTPRGRPGSRDGFATLRKSSFGARGNLAC